MWIRFSINDLFLQNTATIGTHIQRAFLKGILRDKKSVPLVATIFFNKIVLPLGSTFRKKWKTKIMDFSKSIILSRYEELGITSFLVLFCWKMCHMFPCFKEKPAFPARDAPLDERNFVSTKRKTGFPLWA